MNQRFDTILKSGTVVNQDGEGVRDIGITGGRIAAIGALGTGLRRRGDRLQGPAHPARRDRHPGAFSRAGPDAQGRPRNRIAQRRDGRRHGGVRDAEHRSPDHHRGRPSPTRSRRGHHRMHCDFAFFIGGTRENVAGFAGAGTRAGLRRRQGVHRLVHRRAAGRGRRKPAADLSGDPPPRRVSCRGRIPPQRAQAAAHRGRSALASGVARRDRGADGDAAAGQTRARDRQAHPCAAHLDQGGDRVSCATTRMSPPARRRRIT